MNHRIRNTLVVVCLLLSLTACAQSTPPATQGAASGGSQSSTAPVASSKAPAESNAAGDSSAAAVKNPLLGHTDEITFGTTTQRGFLNNNVLHTAHNGDVHYSSYIPKSYDGTKPYALFLSLPSWGGLYFQGVGKNMVEDFGVAAQSYHSQMIILSLQLDGWAEDAADQVIALTEYFLAHYNIDPSKVYLEGYSAGGETGSIVICQRPELYTAFLSVSSKWDGAIESLVAAETPVYMVIGESDRYYGSAPAKAAYAQLRAAYEKKGLRAAEIDQILTLDVKDPSYFAARGYTDQHSGGASIAHDKEIMGWLFGAH